MIIPEFAVSFIVAVLFTGLYVFLTRGDSRRTGLIWLFLIIFLTTWAGGIWLKPVGPTLWGVHFLTFLLVGLTTVLFLIIAIPRRAPRGRRETLDMLERIEQKKALERVTFLTLSLFFWILLALLVTVIILHEIMGVNL